METKPCRDPNHPGENPLPLSAFYDTNPVYCKACVVRRVNETRVRQKNSEVLINGYLKRHKQRRAEESALEAAYVREKQESSPEHFQDAFCFIERKPMFMGYVRPFKKSFSWKVA